MSTMSDWEARCMEQHREAVAKGLHDDQCEYGRTVGTTRPAKLMLCHCSKRARERVGFTTPPTDDLYFPPPGCSHCGRDLDHDEGAVDGPRMRNPRQASLRAPMPVLLSLLPHADR